MTSASLWHMSMAKTRLNKCGKAARERRERLEAIECKKSRENKQNLRYDSALDRRRTKIRRLTKRAHKRVRRLAMPAIAAILITMPLESPTPGAPLVSPVLREETDGVEELEEKEEKGVVTVKTGVVAEECGLRSLKGVVTELTVAEEASEMLDSCRI